MQTKLTAIAVAIILGGVANAQSLSSFQLAIVHDISTVKTGNSIKLNVGPAPTLTLNNVLYHVNSVFGVWALDDNHDLSANGSTTSGWSFDTNFSNGRIAGWKTNPNSGLEANENKTFTYSSLSGTIEGFGYHLRVDEQLPDCSNTAYFRTQTVPEPASMVALGLGLAGAVARKKRK